MEYKDRVWCDETLALLPYVRWDRYIRIRSRIGGHVYRVYGWIERVDAFKDFVVVDLVPKKRGVCLVATSSARYSEDICRRWGLKHTACEKWGV